MTWLRRWPACWVPERPLERVGGRGPTGARPYGRAEPTGGVTVGRVAEQPGDRVPHLRHAGRAAQHEPGAGRLETAADRGLVGVRVEGEHEQGQVVGERLHGRAVAAVPDHQ